MFSDLLAGDSDTRYLRPNLYDLVAHRAIKILSNPLIQLQTSTPEQLDLSDPKWLSDHRSFSTLKIPAADSVVYYAAVIRIFQDLLKYHADRNNLAALADADLKRLAFIYSHNTSEDRTARYRNSLEVLADYARSTAIYPDILYEEAVSYNTVNYARMPKPDLVKVVEIADQIVRDYPKSISAQKAEQLVKPIKSKNITLQLPMYSLPGSPIQVQISHKNTDTAYFQVYQTTMGENNMSFDDQAAVDKFKETHRKVAEWKVKLPTYNDFQVHTLMDTIGSLPVGNYLMISARGADVQAPDYTASYSHFNVTSLAVTNRTEPSGLRQFMVLDRVSGKTIESAHIQKMHTSYGYSKRIEGFGTISRTNQAGTASMPVDPEVYQFIVSHKGDSLIVFSNGRYQEPNLVTSRLVLMTDRPIYRPGQTIFFKGLLIETEKLKNKILPGQTVNVVFKDANRKDISSLSLTTNEFGTIQGSFEIPSGRLNGQMQLTSTFGSITVQVEEYKRPGFEIIFNKPDQRYRLNDSIRVSGKAITYSGYSLSGGLVKYTVHRNVHPSARSFQYFPPEQIAWGSTKTDTAGNFTIPFFTSMKGGLKTIYSYVVKADVTDLSGETISGSRNINAGTNDIILGADIPAQLFLESSTDSIPFLLTNLNGQPVSGKLTAVWNMLQPPGRLTNLNSFQDKADNYALSREEFIRAFPNEAYQGEDNPQNWPVAIQAFRQEIVSSTGAGMLTASSNELAPGYYKVRLSTLNSNGDTVGSEHLVRIYNSQPLTILTMKEWVVVKETSIDAGNRAEFRVAGASAASRIYYEVYYRDRIVERVWLDASPEQKIIHVSPQPDWVDAFAVQFTMVQNGGLYNILQTVTLKDPSRELDIKFLSFRDKLQPGENESWRLSISSKTGEKQVAELAATLYDASLDNLRTMNWPNQLSRSYRYEIYAWGHTANLLRSSNEM